MDYYPETEVYILYKIVSKRFLNEAKNVIEMVVEAPLVAKNVSPDSSSFFA